MHVVIIGGGLAGLAAALKLESSGARVTILEASARLGGQIHSERASGFIVEHGAEGFSVGSEAPRALCERLGIGERVVGQDQRRSYVLRGRALHALQEGEAAKLLGFRLPAADRGRGILSLRAGMGDLVDALVTYLGNRVEIRRSWPAESLDAPDPRMRVGGADGSICNADAAILAVAPRAAAKLVRRFAPDAAGALECVPHISSVTVSLALPRDSVSHPLDGTGFILETVHEAEGLRACTFTSSKLAGRAPEGWCLLRAFFRPRGADLVECSDTMWRDRAVRLLAPVLGFSAPPTQWWVSRWPGALPRHSRANSATIAAAASALRARGPLELAGAAYRCCGIDGAIVSGVEAARAVVARVTG